MAGMVAVMHNVAHGPGVVGDTSRREVCYDRRRNRRLGVLEAGEIDLLVFVNLRRGEEFSVVVLAGEAEMGAVVAAQDARIVSPVLIRRMDHPTRAIVV